MSFLLKQILEDLTLHDNWFYFNQSHPYFANSWLDPLPLWLFLPQNWESLTKSQTELVLRRFLKQAQVLLVTKQHSPLLPQSAQEMSSSGLLSRFCSLVPKQKLQMGMGSATGWQRDRAEGERGTQERREKVETVSQLHSLIVQMKTTKWPCVSCHRGWLLLCVLTSQEQTTMTP